MDGQAAVLTHPVGSGSITYVGAWLDAATLDRLTAHILDQARVKPILANVLGGVEVCRRTGDHKSVLILINHNTTAAQVELHVPMRDIIGRNIATRSNDLPAYGVAVLTSL